MAETGRYRSRAQPVGAPTESCLGAFLESSCELLWLSSHCCRCCRPEGVVYKENVCGALACGMICLYIYIQHARHVSATSILTPVQDGELTITQL